MSGKLVEYLSRKFVLALLSLAGGFYLTLTQDSDKIYAFATLVGVVLAFYNGSNTAEAILAARNPKKE
jgi:hypothetical protein